MTDKEINEIAYRRYPKVRGGNESEIQRVELLRYAFIDGMKFMQNKYIKTSAWIAVDERGTFVLSGEKPSRYKFGTNSGVWVDVTPVEKQRKINMSWKDNPKKVEILIKK